MDAEKLAAIVKAHGMWLRGEEGGARADLARAYLAGANLTDANLTRANLTDAIGISAPRLPKIDARILQAIEAGGKLNMARWHTCATTHCRAGWAICLAGEAGQMLEERIGTSAAGALIYAASRPGQRVPDFHASDDDALADIRKCAAEQQSVA